MITRLFLLFLDKFCFACYDTYLATWVHLIPYKSVRKSKIFIKTYYFNIKICIYLFIFIFILNFLNKKKNWVGVWTWLWVLEAIKWQQYYDWMGLYHSWWQVWWREYQVDGWLMAYATMWKWNRHKVLLHITLSLKQ